MKIKDILNEQHGGIGSLQPGVQRTLPLAMVFPGLANQDPYLQYRFGLAMAAAGAVAAGEVKFELESAFGENLAIVARSKAEEDIIKIAQGLDPRAQESREISTRKSEESPDVNKQSPMTPKGPIKRK